MQLFRNGGEPDEVAAPRPAPTMLAPTERRRAPDTVALAMELAARACTDAGVDPRELPSVFACTHGDLAISDYMSATLAADALSVSPIRFHNSVHNAAAGYWSIGTGCTESYTALSAAEGTFANGLLEALSQSQASGRPVLLVAYDVAARGPLSTVVQSEGLMGMGLIVSAAPGPRAPRAQLAWNLRAGAVETVSSSPGTQALAANAMAQCLPVAEALAASTPRAVSLRMNQTLTLELDIRPTMREDEAKTESP